jgi:hypothetical protein
MAYDKEALRALIAVDDAKRHELLARGGNRGTDWFKAIWPYGVTTNTGEPTLETMSQSYDMSAISDAQLEAILKGAGLRSYILSQAMVA